MIFYGQEQTDFLILIEENKKKSIFEANANERNKTGDN